MTTLEAALFAAMLMAWGNFVDDHCPMIERTSEYTRQVQAIEEIPSEGTKFGMIIAASMQARTKMREFKDPCQYIQRELTKKPHNYFRTKWWQRWLTPN